MKEVSFEILTESRTSEADKLEKIDWDGDVIPRAKASKVFLLDEKSCTKWGDGGKMVFGDWGGYVTIKKEKGVWEVGNNAGLMREFKKVDCSTLPPCLTE